MQQDSMAAILAQATPSLFRSLTDAALRGLEPELSMVRLDSGETLFTAGAHADAVYVVVSGRLRAVLQDDRGERVLGEIGRGESVGEMALLSGEPRSATVYAIRDTDLIKLSKAGFERLVDRQPAVTLELARLIIARYQQALDARTASQPIALAVIPCDAAAAAQDCAGRLVRALSAQRRVLHVEPERLRAEHGLPAEWLSDDAGSRPLAAWLHEQEVSHDHLVYAGDPRASAWTRLCLRQADLVLFVGTGSPSSIDGSLLDLIQDGSARQTARRELALLYDSSHGSPSGTADWLARVPVVAHHHVDPGSPRDCARLARLLTGTATCLVLGGGGARGLAHIGVLRALEEAGLAVDVIGGTSIGAIIGAQYASGWDAARVLDETRRRFVDAGTLNDYTIPAIALLRGKRYFRALQHLFGERRIEDLPFMYYCVSTNLTRGASTAHHAGPLCKWIAASIAVPGVGPPIFHEGEVLVDGGVLNNLPVDFMRGLGRGPVLASAVSPAFTMQVDAATEDFTSPWRLAFNRLNPLATPVRVPTMASILMRAASLPRRHSENEIADLVFEPPLEEFKLLEWRSIDRLVDIGYRTAVASLERWPGTASLARREPR